MAEFKSKRAIVSKAPYELYMAFVDMRNFVQFIPEDKRGDVTADFDTIHATVQGFPIGVKVVQRTPYSKIEFADDGAPFRFKLTMHFDAASDPYKTDFQICLDADLNLMMKMLLGSKIQGALDKVVDSLKVSGRHISVDAPFVDGEDNSLLDVLVNDDSPMADNLLVNESLSREIDRALSTLTDREKEIIQMFFGIGMQEMTLEEIGDRFGLTRERVRQIKEKAIRRLKSNQRNKLLKSYLG